MANGLDQLAWEMAAGGAGPDPKGFSVTDRVEIARDWPRWRALERLGDADRGVVLEADSDVLPLATGQPGQGADPGESFVRPEDFVQVGPRVFEAKP